MTQNPEKKETGKQETGKWEDDPLSAFDDLLVSDKPKEVKVASSPPPPTNAYVTSWGDLLHRASILNGTIIVTMRPNCGFLKGSTATSTPAFPITKETKHTASADNSWFAIGFEDTGASAPKAHWRQYIYRTAEYIDTSSIHHPIIGDTLVQNMAYMSIVFTDPKDPVRSLDSGSNYDMNPNTAKVRETTRIVMLDQPGGVIDELHRLAGLEPMGTDSSVRKLEERRYAKARQVLKDVSVGCRIQSTAYFDTYLCLDDKPKEKPYYHVALAVTWEYTCLAAPGTVSFGGYVPKLTKVEHTFFKGESVSSIPDYQLLK